MMNQSRDAAGMRLRVAVAPRLGHLKFVLLLVPALFWSGIFLALAGVRPLEGIIESMPDALQMLAALGCPLLAVFLGVKAAGQTRVEDGRRIVACWATVFAGVALFVFAALVSLTHS
ncbi:MAG TPA: hypothetical protein VF666_20640 [Pyrinomonadaceae bacterium]|jgi:hypothetical protein